MTLKLHKTRISRISKAIFPFLLGALLHSCDVHKKTLVKQGKISSDVKYLGGKDGGSYILVTTSSENLIDITFFDHWTGDKIKTFHFKNSCSKAPSVKEILGAMEAFNNQKIIWKDNKPLPCLIENN